MPKWVVLLALGIVMVGAPLHAFWLLFVLVYLFVTVKHFVYINLVVFRVLCFIGRNSIAWLPVFSVFLPLLLFLGVCQVVAFWSYLMGGVAYLFGFFCVSFMLYLIIHLFPFFSFFVFPLASPPHGQCCAARHCSRVGYGVTCGVHNSCSLFSI